MVSSAQASIRYRLWLHSLAIALVVCTFLLIAVGGAVTSTGNGLAVPDGWTTFGYYTLIAPLEVWAYQFGTLIEHSHRQVGNALGMLSIALAIALGVTQKNRRGLRWAGGLLLVMVILQGWMGVKRVVDISQAWAMVHGIFGQLIFCATVILAAATSKGWIDNLNRQQKPGTLQPPSVSLRAAAIAVAVALVLQLVLGAAVRHFNAWGAIPDFPLVYGQWLPPVKQAVIDAGGSLAPDTARLPATVAEVHLQFMHRVMALIVTLGVLGLTALAWRHRETAKLARLCGLLLALLALQWGLGIAAALIGRARPEIATTHQTLGAVLLGVTTLVVLRAFRPIAAGEQPREQRP